MHDDAPLAPLPEWLLNEQELLLVLRLDTGLRITAANRLAQRLLPGQLIGAHFADLALNFADDRNWPFLKPQETLLINLPTVYSLPATFLLRCLPDAQGWTLLGALNAVEQVQLLERTLELYREQTQTIRQLHQTIHELRTASAPPRPGGATPRPHPLHSRGTT